MSDAPTKPAGKYSLAKFEISTIATDSKEQGEVGVREGAIKDKKTDLKAIIHTWTIKESIQKGYVSGSAKVYDSEGIYYKFPLRGQEKILIQYTDYHGESREEEYFLYSITDIKSAKKVDDNVLEYTIHFCSWGKFWSGRYSVSRCIADGTNVHRRYIPVSDQVQTLFDDYYKAEGRGTKKDIRIHPTDGSSKIVIPNVRPEDAMHLMSRKAYNAYYLSNYYRFFESRQEYNFINIEQLNGESEAKEKYIYASGAVNETPEAELLKMTRIIDLDMMSPVDTVEAINEGAYYKKLSEVDIINRRVITQTYEHDQEYISYTYPGMPGDINLKHTSEFINEHMNDWVETMVFKDYPDSDAPEGHAIRPKPHYGEIYNGKYAHLYDYKQSRYAISIYGNNKLCAGDYIEIELPYFSVYDKNEQNVDGERSGTFIIESIENVFYEQTYIQKMVVSKGPLNDVPAK